MLRVDPFLTPSVAFPIASPIAFRFAFPPPRTPCLTWVPSGSGSDTRTRRSFTMTTPLGTRSVTVLAKTPPALSTSHSPFASYIPSTMFPTSTAPPAGSRATMYNAVRCVAVCLSISAVFLLHTAVYFLVFGEISRGCGDAVVLPPIQVHWSTRFLKHTNTRSLFNQKFLHTCYYY